MALSRRNDGKTHVCPVAGAANVEEKKYCFRVTPLRSTGEIFTVDTIHISRNSDAYKSDKTSYGGIIVYGREGKGDWITKNGKHCKSGYVVITETDTEEFKKLQDEWPNEPGKVHGIIYRRAFDESCNDVKVVAEGFAIMNGKFKTVSGAFNPNKDDYHDSTDVMNQVSAKCVKKLVKWWKKTGNKFQTCPDHSVKSLLSSDND